MAGASIDIDDAQVLAALKRLQERCGDLRPVFQDIGEYWLKATTDRLEAGIDPEGRRYEDYAPLSEEYKRVKKNNTDKILILSGDLKEYLYYQESSDYLELISNRKYSATHQFGRTEAHIPERPFLGVSADDKTEMLAIITRHLQDAA